MNKLFKYAFVINQFVIPSFMNVHAPYVFESTIELTLLLSIRSRPIVLKRSVDTAAFPNMSLKINKRPLLLETTGSVTVFQELDKFRGTIVAFEGIVMGCAIPTL